MANVISDTENELVTVPKSLLRKVLDEAEISSAVVEGEFSTGCDDLKEYQATQARIDELRNIAGIAKE